MRGSTPYTVNKSFETETIQYLVGELGIQILALIDQGCANDAEIMKFGTFSRSCLEVKIPLLKTLGLIREDTDGYVVTSNGQQFLADLFGW